MIKRFPHLPKMVFVLALMLSVSIVGASIEKIIDENGEFKVNYLVGGTTTTISQQCDNCTCYDIYVNETGDTMTGNLIIVGGNLTTNRDVNANYIYSTNNVTGYAFKSTGGNNLFSGQTFIGNPSLYNGKTEITLNTIDYTNTDCENTHICLNNPNAFGQTSIMAITGGNPMWKLRTDYLADISIISYSTDPSRGIYDIVGGDYPTGKTKVKKTIGGVLVGDDVTGYTPTDHLGIFAQNGSKNAFAIYGVPSMAKSFVIITDGYGDPILNISSDGNVNISRTLFVDTIQSAIINVYNVTAQYLNVINTIFANEVNTTKLQVSGFSTIYNLNVTNKLIALGKAGIGCSTWDTSASYQLQVCGGGILAPSYTIVGGAFFSASRFYTAFNDMSISSYSGGVKDTAKFQAVGNGGTTFMYYNASVKGNLTVEEFTTLKQINLPSCSAVTNGSIARDSSGLVYCDGSTWQNIAFS